MDRQAYVPVLAMTFSLIVACGGTVITSGEGDDAGGATGGGAGASGTTGDGGSGGTGYAGTAGTGYGGTGYAGTAGTGYGGTGYGGTGYAGTAGTGYAGTAGTGYGGTGGFGGDCSSSPACDQCCEVQNELAMQMFYKILSSCACNPDECGTACPNFCAQPVHLPPGPCQDCVVNAAVAGSCSWVIGECLGDVNCAPALSCLLSCP